MSLTEYEVPWLAQFFHSFPRLDLTFFPVNSTFSPGNTRYRESLIIWAAVPVLWLVLTLLIFLMYFCYRCCQRDVEKKQRVPCLRWSMAILALVTCGIIGLGFYGNEECKKGIGSFASSAGDADATTNRMKQEVHYLQRTINETVDRGIDSMQKVFRMNDDLNAEQKDDLERLSQRSLSSARAILQNARHIQARSSKVDMASAIFMTREVAFYFWLGVVVMLACFILLCLNLLLGIGRSSKCILLLFCALGIISLVVCWISAGIFFGTSVGVSDFCMAPDTYFEQMVAGETRNYGNGEMVNGIITTSMERDVLKYYISCDSRIMSNPFRAAMQSAQESVRLANNSLNRALNIAYTAHLKQQLKPYVSQVNSGLDDTMETLLQLNALVECTNLHKDYTTAVKGICYTSLPGFAFLLISTVVTGLLLTLLVLLASRAWRHFSRSQYAERQDGGTKGYQEVDEDDPFLPRPDPNSPSYYSFTRQGPRGNPRAAAATGGEQITMQRRNTPPPAYNSYGYNHSNASPSPDDNHIPDFGSDSQA